MEWIGLVAAALTSVSFFPQAVRVIRTRQLMDISLSMYIVFVAGVTIWIVYGLMLHLTSIFICNVVTLIPASIILILKIQYVIKTKSTKKMQRTKIR
ncbi:SemiSWEET transporter [Sporolactobacillus sp. Y61]|uniref:SemiSWEET transporter n=1 Tax=Sporolactobacillus sp. Y61 TaxID=3160863 RepID=A0AAU8II67_9BACL